MASQGSCMCGDIKYEFSGEPSTVALCHCADCRKISGGTHSLNYVISNDNFKILSGTPKTWSKTADSGKTVVSSFCGNCGSTLFRETETFGPNKVLKAGTMTNGHDKYPPQIELFAADRVNWQPQIKGSEDKKAMS